MFGPDVPKRHAQCGQSIVQLEPTPYLRFVDGQLEQWWEGMSTESDVTYVKGEWVRVPS